MSTPKPQLSDALSDSEYRTQFLLEVSQAANAHLELTDVLEALSIALEPRICFDAIAIDVLEGDSVRLHSLYLRDTPRNPGESLTTLVARARAKRPQSRVQGGILLELPIADTIIGKKLVDHRGAYFRENLAEGPRIPEEELLLGYDVRSYISLPLLRREHLIGSVTFVSYQPRRFPADEIRLLEDASIIVSIAVSNALAYEEIKTLQEKLRNENLILQDEIDQRSMYEEIVGSSRELHRVLETVERVAPTDSTVLLTGETGTGKELVARAIHRRSNRANRALVKVNCAALPAELIASELFGHEKGAFTGALQRRIGRFEAADGGTIFLDEIGELTPDMQVALLRVLQEHEFERVGGNRTIHTDVRVIAATNRDLENEVAAGKFRGDLYYRLNVFPVHCPPLRDRREDIPLLVEYFMSRFGGAMGKRIDHIDTRTFDYLMKYHWPGNIRELQNVIERAVILADGRTLRLERNVFPQPKHPAEKSAPATPLEERDAEKSRIEAALRETGGRVSGSRGAAARLGIPASTLESRIRALGINKHAFRWRG